MNRHHFVAQKRSLSRTPSLRATWRTLLGAATDLAEEAQGRPCSDLRANRRGSAEARLSDFRHLVREARVADFPIEGASIAYAAEGFLQVARGFCEAGTPELREAIAGALAGCAAALTDILDTARAAEAAEHTRRIMGERAED